MANVQAEWREKWEKGLSGWHRSVVDASLQQHLNDLTGGKSSASILVPWCGKSLDLQWLCSQGHDVVGIELSEIGVKQHFEENSIPYSVINLEGELTVYQAKDRSLKIICGDYYKVTKEIAGTFEAVWDINAFGAAEPADREKYISVLASLLRPNGRILLCNWEYGDKVRPKAPYSVPSSLVTELFGKKFDVKYLGSRDTYSAIFTKKFDQDWAKELLHFLSYKK